MRLVPADKMFQGFAAHIHQGSICRPRPGDRVELTWRIATHELKPGDVPGGELGYEGRTRKQTIELPAFDPEIDNWYGYFTLNPNGKWSTVFEGVQPKTDNNSGHDQ
jgi:hypothetical protein